MASIDRTRRGVLLRVDEGEAELLVQVLSETAEALQPGVLGDGDPVAERLFPAAYADDAEAERDFRELTEPTLRSERIERAEACVAEVAGAKSRRGGLAIELDPDAAQRWTQALNDVRLALGTRLGITEDDDHDVDPDDPLAGSRLAYVWLTAVQDGLVQTLLP